MELVKPGNYLGKVVDYSITQTKKGAPQAAVKFSFKEDGVDRVLTWFSGFGDKQIKHTLKALVLCGLNTDVESMSDGLSSNALDTNKEVLLVVEHDSYDGKTSAKIAWVNDPNHPQNANGAPNANKFGNIMAKSEVKAKLGLLNLKGELAMVRQQMGVKVSAPCAQQSASDFDQQDVGF